MTASRNEDEEHRSVRGGGRVAESASRRPDRGLLSASYLGLLLTQFLGATNDNTLRWMVIGLGKQYVHESRYSLVVAAGAACFVLPYLLLAAPAGWLADRYSKRQVIVVCKIAEIAIMVLASVAVVAGSMTFMFVVVGLMGAQSALFGPAKLGSIPEMLHPRRISAANGWIGMTTVLATVTGMGIGSWLSDPRFTGYRALRGWWLVALVLVSFSIVGWVTSLWIARLAAANPKRPFPFRLVHQTIADLKVLGADRNVFRVAMGIMFFWSLGMLVQLNIDQFAVEGGADRQTQAFPLLAALIVGVGGGSVLAGLWSGNKIELGILPLGAGGLALFSVLLFTVKGALVDPGPDFTTSYLLASIFLVLLGICAGLFDIPLEAYLQHRSQPKHRGSIIAASNFLTFAGMLFVSLVYMVLRTPLDDGDPFMSSREIFLLCGALTIPVCIYIVKLIPQATIRFIAWLATHSFYRVRVIDLENLPERGGALLVANHVSWLDGVLLVAISSRPVRLVISADLLTARWSRWLARTMGAIAIRRTPKAIITAIEEVREALLRGELVCMFPEGEITKSGQLQSFRPGVVQMLQGTQVPAIPVYLDELWGSIFTFEGRRFFWKWPRMSQRVSIWIGRPIDRPHTVRHLRQEVQDLGAEAVARRKVRTMILPRTMLRTCRRALFRWKVADSTGVELTGGTLLMRSLILRRLLLREVLSPDERHVGILLPPSAGAVITNAAVTLARRVAANLNYTVTQDVMNACIRQAGIRHVLTSRKVMERFDFHLDAEVVFLEDLREKLTTGDKLAGAVGTYLTPSVILERQLGLQGMQSDDDLTVIFTSGSTGIPKGVQLTFQNVGSNVEAIRQVVHLDKNDTLLGVLPFFHSFGFTVTLWTVLSLDLRGVYHFSPLEPKVIGKLVHDRKVNLLLATPTFLRSYLKRCTKEEFATLEMVIAGAEKLPKSLCDAFEEKFGVRPVEGYGTTELSPLVSVNVPPSRSHSSRVEAKEGTVGRCVPGVTAKVVDPDSFEPLPTGEAGMLLIKGPNVMKGYLNEPEKTAEVVRDGWYVTGDIARIDDDGFIEITGRLSRFSKIGGEMIPHVKVEEALEHVLGLGESDEVMVAVTSVPDERKGEKLIVLHRPLAKTPDEICGALRKQGMSNLWIPDTDAFVQVDQIPVLGSGKLDLKRLEEMAKERIVATQ